MENPAVALKPSLEVWSAIQSTIIQLVCGVQLWPCICICLFCQNGISVGEQFSLKYHPSCPRALLWETNFPHGFSSYEDVSRSGSQEIPCVRRTHCCICPGSILLNQLSWILTQLIFLYLPLIYSYCLVVHGQVVCLRERVSFVQSI